MTNISKKALSQKQELALTAEFFNFVSNKSATKVESTLVSLMGYEEKMMLVKRFAVIVMLWRKCTMYEISKKLMVSTSTVARIEHDYRNDKYAEIVKILENKGVSILAILEGIDSALHLGGLLPHYGMTHKMEDYKKFQEAKRKKERGL
jgi:uncharacterized protein YerC